MLARQELTHHLSDDGRASQAAPRQNFKAQIAAWAPHDVHADVMDLRGRPVLRGPGHRDLEFARQVSEFRVEGRPLTDELAPWGRIPQLLGRSPRQGAA